MLNRFRAQLANRKNGNPSSTIKVIGVAGSYGKTSVVHTIYQLLKNSGEKVGLISSTGYIIDPNSTKELSVSNYKHGEIHKLLAIMVKNHITYCILEVSSKELKNSRYEGINFDSGVITNISGSHLGFYGTLEKYLDLK